MPWLTHADFVGLVGDSFEVPASGQTLVLAAATQGSVVGGCDSDGRTRHQFSLVLTGPLDRALPQGTVRLEHEGLGDLLLFLVPLGPAGDTMRYEAAFA